MRRGAVCGLVATMAGTAACWVGAVRQLGSDQASQKAPCKTFQEWSLEAGAPSCFNSPRTVCPQLRGRPLALHPPSRRRARRHAAVPRADPGAHRSPEAVVERKRRPLLLPRPAPAQPPGQAAYASLGGSLPPARSLAPSRSLPRSLTLAPARSLPLAPSLAPPARCPWFGLTQKFA